MPIYLTECKNTNSVKIVVLSIVLYRRKSVYLYYQTNNDRFNTKSMGQVAQCKELQLKISHNHPQRTTLWRMRYPQHCFWGQREAIGAEYSPEMVDAIFSIDGVMWDCLREKQDKPLHYEVQIFAQGRERASLLEMLLYLSHNNDQGVYLAHSIPVPGEGHVFTWSDEISEITIILKDSSNEPAI